MVRYRGLLLIRRGRRDAGGAAALSRGEWYAIAVVFFLEGATEKLAGRRLVEGSGCEGSSELELGRWLVVA